MTSLKQLATISTIAVSTTALFSIIFFVQASNTQGALEAIQKALDDGQNIKALNIFLNPQKNLAEDNFIESTPPGAFNKNGGR